MTVSTSQDWTKGADSRARGMTRDFLTLTIAGQMFGIPVLIVQDVLREQKIARIPLAPPEVAGSLNLRGRIVTAIDVRKRLGLPPRDDGGNNMSVVVEHGGELYSLIIDRVGDVLSFVEDGFEKTPATLDSQWKEIATGVYRLDDRLVVILDVAPLLNAVHMDDEDKRASA